MLMLRIIFQSLPALKITTYPFRKLQFLFAYTMTFEKRRKTDNANLLLRFGYIYKCSSTCSTLIFLIYCNSLGMSLLTCFFLQP